MNASQAQLDYLREYTPDVVAALTNLGQAGAYYDANGHYERTQPALFPFVAQRIKPAHACSSRPSATRACTWSTTAVPGSAVQPSPDGSTPQSVPGCSTSSVPPGP